MVVILRNYHMCERCVRNSISSFLNVANLQFGMCFLQVDSRIGAQLLESIIFIIDSVLPMIRKLPFSVTEDLEQDLKHMIVRHSFLTVVHACVRYPLLLNNPHSWLYRSFLASHTFIFIWTITYVHGTCRQETPFICF